MVSQNQGFKEQTSSVRGIRHVADEHVANVFLYMSMKCDGSASGSDQCGLRSHITTGNLEFTDRGDGNLKQFKS